MDGVEAVAAPWLLLLDGELRFKQALRTYGFVVDAAKGPQTRRTRLRLDTAVVLGAQKLVNLVDSTKEIPTGHVKPTKSTIDPTDRLVISLTDLPTVVGAPAGIYEGNIADTAAANQPIAKVVVE